MVLMKLKWNKLTFDNVEVHGGMTVDELKESVYRLTNVPKDRQKLMCKGAWLAVLKDTQDLSQCKLEEGMSLTLMGTADTVQAPSVAVKFLEEMNAAEKAVAGSVAPAGLVNLGNTCYMNSVLQCIRAIPQVKEALQSVSSPHPVTLALRALINQLETSASAVTPFQFVALVRQAFPQFNERGQSGGFAQQDAEEFFSSLNGVLAHDDAMRRAYNESLEIAIEEKLECTESPEEAPAVRNDTAFKLVCNIQGGAGSAVVVDFLRDGIKLGLESSIEKFSESLQRNAVYKKTMRIASLPKCACIQMMRFFWQRASPDARDQAGSKLKILRKVAFHDKFDIYEFCNEALQAQIREARKEEGNEMGVYELIAVTSHKGRSADSGHYIGYSRQKENPHMWWVFDDDKVSELRTEDILQLCGGGDRDMAYLLFFRHLGK